MRPNIFYVTVGLLIVVIALSGCDSTVSAPYQLVPISDGQVYRLNRRTGAVAVVTNENVQPIIEYPSITGEELLKLMEPKTWPEVKIAREKYSCMLTTRWMDGLLFYTFSMKPYNESLVRYGYAVQPQFLDVYGLQMEELNVLITSMRGIVDEKGRRTEWQYQGTVKMTPAKAKRISSWTVGWSGFQ